jgi:hypothetical protein
MRSLLLLISMTCCSLLLAVNMASDAHHTTAAAVDQLRYLHADYRRHVPSSYGVADGYWHLEVNYTAPPVPLLARTRYLVANSNSSCWDIAAAQQEPYTAQYHPMQQPPTVSAWWHRVVPRSPCCIQHQNTHSRCNGYNGTCSGQLALGCNICCCDVRGQMYVSQPTCFCLLCIGMRCAEGVAVALCLQDLPGGIPRSVWKWQGTISRRLFDSVPFYLRESEAAGGCQHCTFVLRYKVINGQLYTDKKRRWAACCGGAVSHRSMHYGQAAMCSGLLDTVPMNHAALYDACMMHVMMPAHV